jgi:hypothetical protein
MEKGKLFVAEGKMSKREDVRFWNEGQNRDNFASRCNELSQKKGSRGLVNEKAEAILTDVGPGRTTEGCNVAYQTWPMSPQIINYVNLSL